jgi:arsenite-transporting ATPase
MIRWVTCSQFLKSIEGIALGPRIQFFIGKGGVGKSTASALTALNLALNGRETLLVSMDPAHNQRDIFQNKFSEKPRRVMKGLAVKEVDVDYWMDSYLKNTESQLKKVYSYQSAFNIQNYYKILKYSPGLEEYALLLAFENTLHTANDKDDILFDMPPTALTMRFFSLPFITLIWLEELLKLRNRIYEKKEIVSKIKFGKKEIEQDKVKVRLTSLIDDHTHLREHLTADSTGINLVLNKDRLSFAEAIRIRQKLADIGMVIGRVVVNKLKNGESSEDIQKAFNGYPLTHLPFSSGDLYGLEPLRKFISDNPIFSEPGTTN